MPQRHLVNSLLHSHLHCILVEVALITPSCKIGMDALQALPVQRAEGMRYNDCFFLAVLTSDSCHHYNVTSNVSPLSKPA